MRPYFAFGLLAGALAERADRRRLVGRALPGRRGPRAYEGTLVAMLQAFTHRHPLVNGHSGFFPADYLRLRRAMARFPDEETLRLLAQRETRDVCIEQVRARE